MNAFDVVILAAGKGERMVSEKPKIMHEIMGKPMIDYVVGVARKLNPDNIIAVTGHGREISRSSPERHSCCLCGPERAKGYCPCTSFFSTIFERW